jgi:hypothetical protein
MKRNTFSATAAKPDHVTTEVYLLAERILPLVKPIIDAL